MYKDKPYNYPPSERRRRKRLWFVLAAFVCLSLGYYRGWFGGSRESSISIDRDGKGLWNTFSSGSQKGPVNWTQRREQVKKAMEISWAGYEKYAWGMNSSQEFNGVRLTVAT